MTKPATFLNGTSTVQDGGIIYLTGSASNTYSGTTVVNGSGFLYLQKSGGAIAIPHDLNIAPTAGGTTVGLQAAEQIADTGIVTFVGASGNTPWLDLNGYNETVGGIKDSTTYGVAELFYYGSSSNSVFTLNTATDCSFNGTVRDKATGTATGVLSLVKTGAAKQSLLGAKLLHRLYDN